MATKIRGITVQIGGDTSGLNKALQKSNSELKTTEKQLKDVEKLLKLDPTNTELLAQKQQLLAKRVEETKDKLETLKQTQKEFIDNGGDLNSAGYQALTREIIDTEHELEEATKQSQKFNANLEKASATLGKVSSGAQAVADKTKAISVAGAGVVAALSAVGIKSVKASDELNTLAKQSGLTTEEIQKFEYASDLVDVSTDSIISALKKMRKNMNSTSTDVKDAWSSIGVSIKNADGSFRDSTTVFYEVLEALSKIENETQRDIIAMSLFGKNADELAGIIDDGGEALKDLGDEAKDLGLILDQTTLDSLNEMNDTLDKLKAQFKAAFANVGAKVAQVLAPLLEKVANALNKVLDFLLSLDTEALQTVLVIATIVASISPIAAIVAKIAGALQSLIPIISTINAFILANPVVLLIAAIVAAVTALTVLIIKNWEKIKAVLSTVAGWIKAKVIDPIVGFFKSLWEQIKSIFKAIGNFFIGIINKAIEALNFVIRGLNKISIKLPDWGVLGKLAGKSFGINIKEIGKIPMLAKGGVLSSGSAIVGEAGAELLTMDSGKAIVRPLTSGQGRGGITVSMSNTFYGYTSAQGTEMSRDLVRIINTELGRVL